MYSKNSVIKLTKSFSVCATDVEFTYCRYSIIFKPFLIIFLPKALVYAAGAIAAASVIVALPVSAASFGPIDEETAQLFNLSTPQNSSYLVKSQSPSKTLQQVPLGFQDEFQRARAEATKNRKKVFRFRYIQKGNIEGLTDSEQNGIGPGHGKSTAALEAAIAHKSSRSWKQVRINALNHAVGKQSFNNFSSYINQQQEKAGLPKLTEFQLRNFMDISFWRTPEKGESDMAKETGDSEYYQLPKLAPNVRAGLFNTKLKYQEQIVKEAVFTHDLTGRLLYEELTGNQNLLEAEAKFVSNHLNAVRFAKPANKTQALLRLGSEPYIQPPLDTQPGTPPITFVPPGPPIAAAPPGIAPPLFIPPNPRSPGIAPPLFIPVDDPSSDRSRASVTLPPIFIPSDTSSDRTVQPSLPLLPSDTSERAPAWNRMVALVGVPVLALLPAILNGGDDDDDSSTSTSSPAAGNCGEGLNPPEAVPTTEQPADGPSPGQSSPSPGNCSEGPGTPAAEQHVDDPSPGQSSPSPGSCSEGPGTPVAVPTTEQPVDGPSPIQSSPSPGSCGEGPGTPVAEQPVDGFPNTPPSSSPGSLGVGLGTSPLLPPIDGPILLPEVVDPETTTIPEPSSILGLVAAGAGLLVAKFKRFRSKKN